MKQMAIGWTATAALALAVLPAFPERTAANIMIIVIATFAWILTLLYGLRSQWSVTKAGRATLYLSLALALFSTQLSMSVWVGSDHWGRNQIRFVLYFTLAMALVYVIWTVLQAQRDERRNHKCCRK